MSQIQTLYVRDGVCNERRGDEMVKVEFCHLQYGNNDGREAISIGRWGTHSENMQEKGVDSHLTGKERQNIATRDYRRFWVVTKTVKDGNTTISKDVNRKTGNISVQKFIHYQNKKGHACQIKEIWSEYVEPFVGVLTVKGLDILAVKHETGMEW